MPAAAWEQALVPVRLGGLGLRGPSTVQKAARLSALEREKALELGADPEHLRLDFEAATKEMAEELKVEYLQELHPSKELQAMLCEPLHQLRLHNLVEGADDNSRQRPASQALSTQKPGRYLPRRSVRCLRRSLGPGCALPWGWPSAH